MERVRVDPDERATVLSDDKYAATRVIGGCLMANITTADVRSYAIARQATRASNAQINRELALLRRMFTIAVESGKLLQKPKIPMLEERNIRQGFFERHEFEDVRALLPSELRGLVTFAYITGWRIPSEVLTLEWRRVDRQAKVIRLEPGTTKNDEGRTFPYGAHPELCEVIDAQWELTKHAEQTRGLVCARNFHRDGRPIKDFRGAWKAACAAAGITRIPHDFRRTAVRNLVRSGVPERQAMKLTGHKTRSVFDRYDIVNEADLEDAVARLADITRGGTGTRRGQEGAPARVVGFPSDRD